MIERLRQLASPPQLLRKRDDILGAAERHGALEGRILNVGSKNVRIGRDCTNLDIAPGPDVDVVGDAHDLLGHFQRETFDTVILSAVLQYCAKPHVVIEQAARVLRPNGLIFVDAPFLQPYCPDGRDLWRFTEHGLRHLCEPHFEVLEVGPSITVGPATAFIVQGATSRISNRLLAAAATWFATLLFYPLKYWRAASLETAGAILLVARKRA
jgi:SAM-dependent methyltransferase